MERAIDRCTLEVATEKYQSEMQQLLAQETPLERMLRKDKEAQEEEERNKKYKTETTPPRNPGHIRCPKDHFIFHHIPSGITKTIKLKDAWTSSNSNNRDRSASATQTKRNVHFRNQAPSQNTALHDHREEHLHSSKTKKHPAAYSYEMSLYGNAMNRRKNFLKMQSNKDIKDAQSWWGKKSSGT
jgi:hypothetical protein